MRLTDLAIQKLPIPNKGQKTYFDGGFGIRVSQGGSKTFVVMYGQKRKLKTLGRYPDIGLKEARRLAYVYLDTPPPFALKTPSSAITAFMAHCETRNRPRTVRDYQRLLQRFPNSFERQDILATLNRYQNTPGELSHLTSAFQIFLNWCVHNGHLDQNPIAGLRNQGKINKRDRVLLPQELAAIWNALHDDTFSIIVRQLILTGQRRSEVQYFTLSNDLITIAKEHTKNKREHIFPVGKRTIPYIQPLPFNGWSKAKRRLDKASGVTAWTLHDIRRTFVSVHAQLGTPIHVAEKLVNHVSGTFAGVRGVYDRHSYIDEMRQAMQTYEDWLFSTLLRHVKT